MSMLQSVISPSSNLFRGDVVALVVFCEKTNIIMALCHKELGYASISAYLSSSEKLKP